MEKKKWELEEKQRWLVETRMGGSSNITGLSAPRHSQTYSSISRPNESKSLDSPNKRMRTLNSTLD